ncbi:MAG: clan AA aspartic protease [Chloroflexota bacterium]|nr:clan AA aspartic protease [Chloroflexota bacterium]MDE2884948.1 clan AA aspartic protease [Chloroflexota bacterium]
MAITQVATTVRNPADPEKAWEGLFLVDTGAIDCLAPRPQLEAIGLMPKGERVYSLADGSQVRMEVTVAQIEIMGEIVGATIVIGDANAEPLLGVTALESAGIEVDPNSQTLRRLPSTRLRGFRVRRWAVPQPA